MTKPARLSSEPLVIVRCWAVMNAKDVGGLAREPSGDRMFNLYAVYRTRKAAQEACRKSKAQRVRPVVIYRGWR